MIISLRSQPIRRAAKPCARCDAATIADRSPAPCRTSAARPLGLQPQDADTARAFFEQNFQPVRIARLGEAEGLLTGYFEPIVAGSRFPNPEFSCPALPPAARPGRCRLQARLRCISEQRRAHRSPQREQRARARTTTAAPSRPARSTGRSSRSAGSRVRPTCSRSRSKARGA